MYNLTHYFKISPKCNSEINNTDAVNVRDEALQEVDENIPKKRKSLDKYSYEVDKKKIRLESSPLKPINAFNVLMNRTKVPELCLESSTDTGIVQKKMCWKMKVRLLLSDSEDSDQGDDNIEIPLDILRVSSPVILNDNLEEFPITVHVQQNDTVNYLDRVKDLQFVATLEDCIKSPTEFNWNIAPLNVKPHQGLVENLCSLKNILDLIKKDHPNNCVYREARKLLNLKKMNKNSQLWTDKYAPKSVRDHICNIGYLKSVKSWLEKWFFSQCNSDSSESFFTDDSEDGSCRNQRRNNVIILQGPSGCGKTSGLQTVCNELGLKILEVNASMKRNGKKLLQQMLEATQSHQVNSSQNNQLMNFLSYSQEPVSVIKNQCVLLVEDVDIVFEQDDGFLQALHQLTLTTKRPIVITTNCMKNNVHVTKYFGHCESFNFKPVAKNSITRLGQLICAIQCKTYVAPEEVAKNIRYSYGQIDLRGSLIQFQYVFTRRIKATIENDEKEVTLSSNLDFQSLLEKYLYRSKCWNIHLTMTNQLRDNNTVAECMDSFNWNATEFNCDAYLYLNPDRDRSDQDINKVLKEATSKSIHLNRKALSLDIYPALRNIGRFEQQRSSSQRRRRLSRFYNYLNDLGVNTRDPAYEKTLDNLR